MSLLISSLFVSCLLQSKSQDLDHIRKKMFEQIELLFVDVDGEDALLLQELFKQMEAIRSESDSSSDSGERSDESAEEMLLDGAPVKNAKGAGRKKIQGCDALSERSLKRRFGQLDKAIEHETAGMDVTKL